MVSNAVVQLIFYSSMAGGKPLAVTTIVIPLTGRAMSINQTLT